MACSKPLFGVSWLILLLTLGKSNPMYIRFVRLCTRRRNLTPARRSQVTCASRRSRHLPDLYAKAFPETCVRAQWAGSFIDAGIAQLISRVAAEATIGHGGWLRTGTDLTWGNWSVNRERL